MDLFAQIAVISFSLIRLKLIYQIIVLPYLFLNRRWSDGNAIHGPGRSESGTCFYEKNQQVTQGSWNKSKAQGQQISPGAAGDCQAKSDILTIQGEFD
jgi:hypothetical protein